MTMKISRPFLLTLLLASHAVADEAGETSLSFSPSGRLVATGGVDHSVRVRDAATGAVRITLRGHSSKVTDVAFSPDGRTIASSGNDAVRLWHVAPGPERKILFDGVGGVVSLDFAPDGRTIATGDQDGSVKFWDVETGERRVRFTAHDGFVEDLVFAPDGRTLATGSSGKAGDSVKIWDVNTVQPKWIMEEAGRGRMRLKYSSDGTILASCSKSEVTLWNPATGKKRSLLKGYRCFVDDLAFTPDGEYLAASGLCGVWLFGVQSGRPRILNDHHFLGGRCAMDLSRDGKRLAYSTFEIHSDGKRDEDPFHLMDLPRSD